MLIEEITQVANDVSASLDGEEITTEVVTAYINGTLPEVVYTDWLAAQKKNDPDFPPEDDIHWSLLPVQDHVVQEAVYAVVRALVPYISEPGQTVPASIQNQTPSQRAKWEEENEVTIEEGENGVPIVNDPNAPVNEDPEVTPLPEKPEVEKPEIAEPKLQTSGLTTSNPSS